MSDSSERTEPASLAAPEVMVHVFGGVGVSTSDGAVSIGGPRQQKLLALLAVRAGAAITNDWLAENLWSDDERPADPIPTVRTYMSRLRAALPDAARPWIETEASAYRFGAPSQAIEHRRFAELRASARVARESGDPLSAHTMLDEALGLWRGDPFIELADLDWAIGDIEQLRLDRLEAQEERWEAALDLGRHTQITGELGAFTADQPLRDRAARQHALALYRSGRSAEALRVIDAHRSHLANVTGLEPSRSVTELEAAILAGDPSLDVAKDGHPLRGYQLLEQIGTGAFAIVWRAIQPSVGRSVAIKQIRSELASQPEFIRRFEAEAHLVARIEHPHIVPLIDYWRDPDSAYLVMRWLGGGTLERRLDDGPLRVEEALSVAEQVGGALAAAHRAGVVHRDVKPANIMFDEDGNAFLTDFGIALEAAESSGPEAALSPGSPAYSSPEQIRQEQLSPESDIFSLGVVLYESLVGGLPFASAERGVDLIDLQLGATPESVNTARRDVPESMAAAIAKAMEKDPSDRFASVDDLLAALRSSDEASGDEAADAGEAADGVQGTPPQSGAHLPNPYKGLRAFDSGDVDTFFGRERLVSELTERLETRDVRSRCVVVVGPSGSGKSSVVRAGLVPALRRGAVSGSGDWFITTMVPGVDPFESLESALLRVAVTPPESFADRLRDGERGILRGVRDCLGDTGQTLALVIDQLEELFTGALPGSADEFLDALALAVEDPSSPLRVIATLRADYYDRPLAHPRFAPLVKEAAIEVTPLAADELERAIVEPARRVGVRFEPGLPVRVATETIGQASPLPLMQFALSELFERREGEVLTLAGYEQVGGLAGALSARADALFTSASEPERQMIRTVFGRLTDAAAESADVRRRVPVADFGDDPLAVAVIERFGAARLLTFDRDEASREPTVEVSHEALLREWPRLTRWLDEDMAVLRTVASIGGAADVWSDGGRLSSDLIRGTRLESAVEVAASDPERLRALDHEFVDAASAAADAEHRTEHRRLRRLRRLVAGTVVALLLAVVAGAVAIRQRNDARDSTALAEQAARDAELSALISASAVQADEDPRLGVLLALEAHRREPGSTTELAVLRAVASATVANQSLLPVVATGGGSCGVRTDGLTEYFVQDGEMVSRDLGSGQVTIHGPPPASCVDWYGHAPTNLRWAMDTDGTRLWLGELGRPWAVEQAMPAGSSVLSTEMLAAGIIAVRSEGDSGDVVSIIDVATGDRVGEPVVAGDVALAGEVSPDGSVVALSFGTRGRVGEEGDVVVIDVTTGVERFRYTGTVPVAHFVFDETAGQFIGVQFDGLLETRDLATAELVAVVATDANSQVIEAGLDDDGSIIVVTLGQALWVDRFTGPTSRSVELRGVGFARLRPDGLMFTVSDADDQLAIVDLDGSALVENSWPIDALAHTAFNADRAAFVASDGAVVVIELATGTRTRFSPQLDDGTMVVVQKAHSETDGVVALGFDGAVVRTEGDRVVERVDLGIETIVTNTRYADLWAVIGDAADGNRRIHLVDLERGRLRVRFDLDIADAVEAHPTAEGGLHVVVTDGTLLTFDAGGSHVGEMATAVTDVGLITLDDRSGKLALANLVGGASIVDPATAEVVQLSERGLVANLGFGRGGDFLVITDPDGSVRLWDVAANRSAGVVFDGFGASTGSPSWYDDEAGTMWIASSGQLLEIPLLAERWLERACETAGRDFSDDEWNRLVPGDEPRRPSC